MPKLTRGGICYNLHESPFVVDTDYLTFHFSSRLYVSKFNAYRGYNVDTLNKRVSKITGVTVDLETLGLVKLYSEIEKRGFLITTSDGEKLKCLEQIQFVGGKVMKKPLLMQSEPSTQKELA